MKKTWKILRLAALIAVALSLSGCDDPQIYGSIGISSGYSSWGGGGWGGSMGSSISFGGRIR
ncbi:MAG: hypothetical protein R6V61_10180 [Wenzhouxiangellaceae bacterium]